MTKVFEIMFLVASVTQVTFSKDYEDWEVKGWKISGKSKKLFLFLLKRIYFIFSQLFILIFLYFFTHLKFQVILVWSTNPLIAG